MRLTIGVLVVMVLVGTGWSSLPASVLILDPCSDLADGMELGDSLWLSDGPPEYHGNLAIGYPYTAVRHEPAFMFQVNGLARGDSVAYARLRFTTLGGDLLDTLRLEFSGLYHCTSQPFGQDFRPSQIPSTNARVTWNLLDPWIYSPAYDPLYSFGPDLSPLLNEILSSTSWPALPTGAFFSLSLEVTTSRLRSQLCKFGDTGTPWPPVQLEIYPTLGDAFLVPPVLGRVGCDAATVSFAHFATIDCYVAYGLAPESYIWAQGATRTLLPDVDPIRGVLGGAARDIDLSELAPDTQYYGRLMFGRPDGPEAYRSPEFALHTQRPPGSAFCFDIVADPHLEMKQDAHLTRDIDLYRVTLRNVRSDAPDFWIGLGDFAITLEAGNGVRSLEEARRIYTDVRSLEAREAGAIPFYFVLGNHEGEVGWLDYGGEGIYTWSEQARAEFVPNPHPDRFFGGNVRADVRGRPPEDYYAWEWGDALFVVLDPFRTTRVKPHNWGGGGSRNGWDWTLGEEQYNWLYQVLSASSRTWKFVFIHHLTGGVLEPIWGPYGRGGIEVAAYAVDGRPSFEWGGEDTLGVPVFAEQRPGWDHGPIRDLLREQGVTAVFHGHDHCYVEQALDGVVYQECPMPSDATYGGGMWGAAAYSHGVRLLNSGHLRVNVTDTQVRVEYVRAYLPGEGENGGIGRAYVIEGEPSAVVPGASRAPALRLRPNPSRGRIWIEAAYPSRVGAYLSLHDVTGRTLSRRGLPDDASGATLPWALTDAAGRPLPNGVYHLRLHIPGLTREQRLLVVR